MKRPRKLLIVREDEATRVQKWNETHLPGEDVKFHPVLGQEEFVLARTVEPARLVRGRIAAVAIETGGKVKNVSVSQVC